VPENSDSPCTSNEIGSLVQFRISNYKPLAEAFMTKYAFIVLLKLAEYLKKPFHWKLRRKWFVAL